MLSSTATTSLIMSYDERASEAEAGSRIALYVATTSAASKVDPSEKVTPSRSLTVQTVASALAVGISAARDGSNPGMPVPPVSRTRPSYILASPAAPKPATGL